jgi:hypothetical protein
LNPETLSPHEQLEKLQAELASRRSIVHFAHTGVSTVWALIIAGAATKLFIDSLRTPWLAYIAAAAAFGLLVYAAVHFRRGRVALKDELARFETLKALRQQLKLDDPSALLPG